MLYREFPPNAHLWNGFGGKIEVDETPLASVQREIREEAGIDLLESPSLFFAGITIWEMPHSASIRGMYTFIAKLSQEQAEKIQFHQTLEGLIAWKQLEWICQPDNKEVVDNLPHLLPLMLNTHILREYFCMHDSNGSLQVTIRPLPSHVTLSDCQGW